MIDIDLDIFKPTGELVETASVSAEISDGIYYPLSDDWGELLNAFTGTNVIIKVHGDIKVNGLDENGELKLLNDDGAEDYENTLGTLIKEFTGNEVQNDED